MSFVNYENFQEAVEANQDKENAKAYATALHHEATGEWPGQKATGDVFDDPDEHLGALLTAARKMGVNPDDEFIATVREKSGYTLGIREGATERRHWSSGQAVKIHF